MNKEIRTNSEAETFALGERLSADFAPGTCVLLCGQLGAGKTAFVRGVCSGLGIELKLVRSPTFTLVNEYRSGKIPVAHADLYRLEGNSGAVDGLLLNEYIDDGFILIVEWAENGDFSSFDALRIDIETDMHDENLRVFRITEPLR